MILVAEGNKESAVLNAEAEKEAAILRAEAEKEKKIKEAEGQAEAIRAVQQATADGIRYFTVTEALKTNTSDAWYDRIAAEDGRQLILSTCYGSGKDGRLLIIAAES